MTVGWVGKLNRAILWRAAKDMTPEKGIAWLASPSCRSLCEQAEVNYGEFTTAMRYILDRSPVQRTVLLGKLKKNIGV